MSLLRRSSSFVLKLHDLDCVCEAIWGSIDKAQLELYIYMSILGRSSSFVLKLCERQLLHRFREQLLRTWLVLLRKLVVMLLELIWVALPPNATSTGPSAF